MLRNKKITHAILLLLLSSYSFALPEDRDQPIQVAADQAHLNDLTGLIVYTGNVEITQGTLKILGSIVEIYRDAQGDISKMVAVGTPAEFHYQSTLNQPPATAYGLRLEYLIPSQTVTVTDQARVIQNQDEFSGDRIVYEMDKSVVNVFGSEEAKTSGRTRVQMTLQPRANQ